MPKALGPLTGQCVLLLDTEIWVHKKRRPSLAGTAKGLHPTEKRTQARADSATTGFLYCDHGS